MHPPTMDMDHGHGGMDMGDSGQCQMNVGLSSISRGYFAGADRLL